MDARILPSTLGGAVRAVASKSMAHRLLILSALSDGPCEVVYDATSEDIEATRLCLDSIARETSERTLPCGESGSTLRFLLPIVGALGRKATFMREGRLAERPLAPLDAQLRAHGMTLVENGVALSVSGRLSGGRFVLPGDVSSQYVSGLLMAGPLLDEPVEVLVSAPVQSRPYIELTLGALKSFGVDVASDKVALEGVAYERFTTQDSVLAAPKSIEVEGDWSNAAFWLAAGALEPEGVTVYGLDLASAQGDRAVLAALAALGARIARKANAARASRLSARAATINVSSIPDLVPPLAAVAATAAGETRLTCAGRLRLKESDRLQSVCSAVGALGGQAHAEGDDLVIQGVEQLRGGTVDAANDHRIAMMAAVMATHAAGPVTVVGAECVRKSYPAFWDDYRALGGRLV